MATEAQTCTIVAINNADRLGRATAKFFAKKSAPKNLFMQNKANFLDTKNEHNFC